MSSYKELGELTEINEPNTMTKYQGTKKAPETQPKYTFLSTHVARRTFCTLSLEKGMRSEMVMSITLHKDYTTFKRYIKQTNSIKAIEMNKIGNSYQLF